MRSPPSGGAGCSCALAAEAAASVQKRTTMSMGCRMARAMWGRASLPGKPWSGSPGAGLACSGSEPQLSPAMNKLLALLLVTAAGCARTDLGAPCHLLDAAGAEIVPLAGRA